MRRNLMTLTLLTTWHISSSILFNYEIHPMTDGFVFSIKPKRSDLVGASSCIRSICSTPFRSNRIWFRVWIECADPAP
jgi:hypothetical protein